MIVRRCTWFYRISGQLFARPVTFDKPVTAQGALRILRRTVGTPVELWGHRAEDLAALHR